MKKLSLWSTIKTAPQASLRSKPFRDAVNWSDYKHNTVHIPKYFTTEDLALQPLPFLSPLLKHLWPNAFNSSMDFQKLRIFINNSFRKTNLFQFVYGYKFSTHNFVIALLLTGLEPNNPFTFNFDLRHINPALNLTILINQHVFYS